MSCHSFDQKDAFCFLVSFLIQRLLLPSMFEKGPLDGKENMLILLTIPGEKARWVCAMFGNFFSPHQFISTGLQHGNDTACISPANLSAPVIINRHLDIFSWTVLRSLNVNAAVCISPAKGGRAAVSESLCFVSCFFSFFFFLEQGSPLWLPAQNALQAAAAPGA